MRGGVGWICGCMSVHARLMISITVYLEKIYESIHKLLLTLC